MYNEYIYMCIYKFSYLFIHLYISVCVYLCMQNLTISSECFRIIFMLTYKQAGSSNGRVLVNKFIQFRRNDFGVNLTPDVI